MTNRFSVTLNPEKKKSMINQDISPTHSALLDLQAERTLVDEAYEFLDEKRMLLAAEILRQLDDYDVLRNRIEDLARKARDYLVTAVGIHGLQGISVYPPLRVSESEPSMHSWNFMGVRLATSALEFTTSSGGLPSTPCSQSNEAKDCQQAFLALGKECAILAGITGNLHRLLSEYRLTERRARALENVIIPEIQETVDIVRTQLEELELEETVRAHLQPAR
jgi:V/A-type H+-transporting ATPase subunit D